jgi:hypothetical protein
LTIHGRLASDGTVVEAVVKGEVCDRAPVRGGRYSITVPLGACPPDFEGGGLPVGEVVTFRVDGELADESARLVAPGFTQLLNLTVGEPFTPAAIGDD